MRRRIAFVDGAQGFVLALAARVLQPGELALHVAGVEHAAHLGHRQAQGGRLGNKAVAGHRMLLVRWVTQSFKHNACPPHYRIKPRMARLLRGCQKHEGRPKAALGERAKLSPRCPAPA